MLIAHMAEGRSFRAFAGELLCCHETLYSWTRKYPEFLEAKRLGEAKCLEWWEAIGRRAMRGDLPGFKASVWVWNMRNRFGWR